LPAALLERNPPIDDGIADAFGLLDQAPLSSREVGGIDRAVILKPELGLLVDDDVGSETLAQDSPIGEPGDPRRQTADLIVGLFEAHDLAVQKRVILTALGLLTEKPQVSLIVDFPDDDPREVADPDWRPPVTPRRATGHGPALADAVLAELRALAPAYAQSCTRRLRSTVGLSGLPPAECGDYVAGWLRGERMHPGDTGQVPAQL
jgi:hypothetical protein